MAVGSAAAAAAALATWSLWIEPRRLIVRRETLELAGWPADLAGLRVALLTDFHAGMPHAGLEMVKRVVATTNAERPDLVCLLGDFIDARTVFSRPPPPEAVAEWLGELRARHGVLAVLGNHDWHAGGRRIADALEGSGICVLEDDARRAVGELWAAGVSDHRSRGAKVSVALAAVPDGAPVLLLAHDPDVFPRVPGRVALTLAGHTHGGQVGIPLLRRPFIPSRYGERFVAGHVVEGGRHLYVSSGLGTSGLPLRFARPPEVVILTLR